MTESKVERGVVEQTRQANRVERKEQWLTFQERKKQEKEGSEGG